MKLLIQIFIIQIIFCFSSKSVAQSDNTISTPFQYRVPVETYVRSYVEPRLQTWLKWDRYEESTTQYKERTSETNRTAQIKKWEDEALAIYKTKYAEMVNWDQFHIEGDYDPDNECFLIRSEQFGQLTVNVPRGKMAKDFVAHFDSIKVSNPDFFFSDNYIGLDKLTFTLSNGQQAIYDSRAQNTYAHLNISYDSELMKLANVNIENRDRKQFQQIQQGYALSDVDTRIPQTGNVNDETYAVIIGNEHYHYESQTRFSMNDAKVFYKYCTNTLGIPTRNIFSKTDATYGDMLTSIQFLKNAAQAKNGNIHVIFYFSGHGMSDIQTNGMHLLPVDCSSTTLQAALKAENLYHDLANMHTLSATVFLDACFSGKSSEGALTALVDGAGIEVTPRKEALNGNLVVFSATTDAEIAYPYEEKQHRMFTYFLLKKLQESKGETSYADLAVYLINNVKSHAFDVNRKMQTPQVQTSKTISEAWKSWKLIK
ncbi:caspase family protein [uncultured Parabacteroides sp.]|uniref:caspase family protein n=1 Tax=uncultured Parabacteroides sp. TaxID=512312 RepID=UPI0025DDC7E5|nr:caspase family protein [uncultured Parabacteroides sp.]